VSLPRALPFALLVAACACVHRAAAVVPAEVPAGAPCRSTVSLEHAAQSPITWIRSADARQQTRLDDWCETVGPVLFEPQPRRTADASINRLAIVTWNTHVGGGDLDALVDAVQRGDFTHGQHPDAVVFLLQEMYRHGEGVPDRTTIRGAVPHRIADAAHAEHARDVRRAAVERGFAILYTPSMRNGTAVDDPEDRGNAILSTLPLSDPAAIELPIEHQRRVVAVATVDGRTSAGEAWRLRVANVHLDTALSLLGGGPTAARRRQATALVSALTESMPFDGPTVLAGDFNTVLGRGEPAIEDVRAVFQDAPPVGDGATWTGPLGLHAHLDYVFAQGRLGAMDVQRLPSRFGSDHYPLLSVIRFAAPAAAWQAPSSPREAPARRSRRPNNAG